jgi:hypothetical protein
VRRVTRKRRGVREGQSAGMKLTLNPHPLKNQTPKGAAPVRHPNSSLRFTSAPPALACTAPAFDRLKCFV